MNAVNLIPADRRKRSIGVSVSPLTLGVMGGLVVILAAAVLYVFAVNDVRTRKSELAQVTANAASWQAAANSYASYVSAAQQQKQQLADIQGLVTGRFPWSLLLSQIGGVMPANAALSTLQATSPSADATAAASSAAGPASAPVPTSQAVQITGCAASQSAVAATMVALGRVHGVGSVALASTTSNVATTSAAPSGSGSGSGAASGACPFPVSFSLSLVLASSASSGTTSGATTPTSTPTTPAATPAASTAATPSTGSAQ